nr:unnamed protein product [Callosobruchus analis]
MYKNRKKDPSKQRCQLKKTIRGLPPLAPKASRWVKFKRWLRGLSLLDEENRAGCMLFFAGPSALRAEFYRHAKNQDKYVIHPFSRLIYIIYLLFFILREAQFWVLPVYCTLPVDLGAILNPFFTSIVASFQSVIIIPFFFIGYVESSTKKIIIHYKKVCLHYLRTFFIPDLIAVMGQVMHKCSPLTPAQGGVRTDLEFAYRCLILVCYCLRLKSLKRTMRSISVASGLRETVYFIIDHLCTMALMMHLLSSVVISIPWAAYDDGYPGYPEDSWLRQANKDNVTTSGISTVYMHSCLMTCCYFFGVSHGGYQITVPNEEIALLMASFLGRLYTLYMTADLLRLFGLVNLFECKYERTMRMLDGYVTPKDLSPYLRQKIFEYCRFMLKGSYVNDDKRRESVSRYIRSEVLLYSARKFLIRIPVFRVLTTKGLCALTAKMQNKLYAPGDKIVGAGEFVTEVNFIKSGTVAMYHNDVELCHIGDDDTFEDIAV